MFLTGTVSVCFFFAGRFVRTLEMVLSPAEQTGNLEYWAELTIWCKAGPFERGLTWQVWQVGYWPSSSSSLFDVPQPREGN